MHDLLLVLSNPLHERHDDFNDWYTNIHIRDVMRAPCAIAVQRFILGSCQVTATKTQRVTHAQYLAIYETYDIEKLSYAHRHVFTPQMIVSDAIDLSHPDDYYYRPVALRQKRPTALFGGAVLLEQMSPDLPDDTFAADYAARRLPAILDLPGVEAGILAVVAEHQTITSAPECRFVGIYRLSDAARAVAAWEEQGLGEASATIQRSLIVSAFDPLIDRITADEVIHPSAEGAAAEGRARAAIGDRIYHGCPPSVSLVLAEPGAAASRSAAPR
jgi:hypothetical protein